MVGAPAHEHNNRAATTLNKAFMIRPPMAEVVRQVSLGRIITGIASAMLVS
jgi:hypothetical protein